MTQVFVAKADLTLVTVPVRGSYPDVPLVDRNFLGTLYTPLSLPSGAIVATFDAVTRLPVYNLTSNWRSFTDSICNGEGNRRIIEVFSEFMQRNANNDVNRSTLLYGSNSATWPVDASARLTEAQRGWNYVTAIRGRADALQAALPSDPTDNSNWPAVITPIYIALP